MIKKTFGELYAEIQEKTKINQQVPAIVEEEKKELVKEVRQARPKSKKITVEPIENIERSRTPIEIKKTQGPTIPNTQTEIEKPLEATPNGKKKAAPRKSRSLVNPAKIVPIHLGYPEKLKDSNFKYRVLLKFVDEHGVEDTKKIPFGTVGQVDMIDFHPDEESREKTRIRNTQHCRGYDSPLKPNFYKIWLLNREKDLKSAYFALRQMLKLDDN